MRESKQSHQLIWLIVMWVCIIIALTGCYDEPTARLHVLCTVGQDTVLQTDEAWSVTPPSTKLLSTHWVICIPTDSSKWKGFDGSYKHQERLIITGECSVRALGTPREEQ